MLVGSSRWLKQLIQIEINRVKNPWLEANQLAIYQGGKGFELGTTVNKSSWRSGQGGTWTQDLRITSPAF